MYQFFSSSQIYQFKLTSVNTDSMIFFGGQLSLFLSFFPFLFFSLANLKFLEGKSLFFFFLRSTFFLSFFFSLKNLTSASQVSFSSLDIRVIIEFSWSRARIPQATRELIGADTCRLSLGFCPVPPPPPPNPHP